MTPKKKLSDTHNEKLGDEAIIDIGHQLNTVDAIQRKDKSPFLQIGTTIKNMFGNFFKAQDKLNRSYEEREFFDKNSKRDS